MTERWLPVVGYEGRYEVSDLGRVRRMARSVICWHGPRIMSARLLVARFQWTCGTFGYRIVKLLDAAGRVRSRKIHRLVLQAFIGQAPVGHIGLHNDGNTENNALGNLRWGTYLENSADKVRHGTQLRGEQVCTAKLKVGDVQEIKRSGESALAIGRRFGVSDQQVYDIRRGRAWKWVAA